MGDKVKFNKFSGQTEDYPRWKRDFTNSMVIKELGHIVLSKKDPKPDNDETEEVKRNYGRQNAKFYAYLCLSLDEKNAELIDSKCDNDGYFTWTTLRGLYERKDLLRMANLRIELANTQLDEGEDMEEFLLKIRS